MTEWSKYYRVAGRNSVEALHARFITHQYPRHAHDYFVVGLVDAGAQSYWYRGARHTTAAGEVFLVNAEEVHTGESAMSGGYIYRSLYPRKDDLVRLAESIGKRPVAPYFKPAVVRDAHLATLLSHCHACLADGGSQIECESLYLQAMARILTEYGEPGVCTSRPFCERPAVRNARDYLEAYFADEISLSDVARAVGLSPYYLAHAFEREVGLPPHRYLEGIRIRKARELLDRGQSVSDTAISVGYSDQSHLTRRFKRFLGVTPGQYRLRTELRPSTSGVVTNRRKGAS